MVEPFNEATMIKVIDEIMNTDLLDHLSVEDQMMVIDLVADSLRRYKGIEVKNFLDEMDKEFANKKKSYRYNLSDL
jgi:hypothetical protein